LTDSGRNSFYLLFKKEKKGDEKIIIEKDKKVPYTRKEGFSIKVRM